MNPTVFADKLKELRIAAGLTQTQLAEMAGMHRQGVAKLEMGEREPTWQTVQVLAAALGVDCTVFVDPNVKPAPAEPARPRGRPRKTDTTPSDPPAAKKSKRKEK